MRIRAELSKKNKYWIDKNRYYELKYFCLQYPEWKKELETFDGIRTSSLNFIRTPKGIIRDYIGLCAEMRSLYLDRICIIEKTARDTDPYLASYILKAVTEGLSYNYLKTVMDIPCSKDTYYDRYRRFFWILSNSR